MNTLVYYTTLALYLVINVLFVEKYAARVTDYHLLFSLAYLLGAYLSINIILKKVATSFLSTKWLICVGFLFICIALGIQYKINPLTIQVDRWSAIHNFLVNLFQGNYPYGSSTHLGGYGSPFPVWQMFHIPFYLVGNVGLSIIIVTIAFIATLYFCHSDKLACVVTILLGISPAFWYEIAVRSDLITNILFVTIIAEWLVYKEVRLNNHVISLGIMAGLILSTRFIAIIPICVIYGYEFLKIGWKKQVVLLLTILATFGLTFLPFVLWEGSTLLFFEYNPFVLQTRQGSWGVLFLFALIAISTTIYIKGNTKYRMAYTGILLTILVVMAFVEKMWQHNLWTELFSPAFDITYLSVALPFYIENIGFSIVLEKNS